MFDFLKIIPSGKTRPKPHAHPGCPAAVVPATNCGRGREKPSAHTGALGGVQMARLQNALGPTGVRQH